MIKRRSNLSLLLLYELQRTDMLISFDQFGLFGGISEGRRAKNIIASLHLRGGGSPHHNCSGTTSQTGVGFELATNDILLCLCQLGQDIPYTVTFEIPAVDPRQPRG